jgi:ABC-2 type transport system permease protein
MRVLDRIRHAPFWPMLWKEFIQMRRDRFTLGLMIGTPAIQLVLFGYAIQTEVRHLPAVVLDESHSAESRALIASIENTGNFDIVGDVADRHGLRRALERGDANAAIVISPDFAIDLKRRRPAQVQVIVDAADPLSSAAALAGASQAGLARTLQLEARTGAILPSIDMRVRPWYNPGGRSAVYIVPGIIGVLLSMTMVIIASLAIVRERERGTLEQLVVTPIGKTSLLLGKIVPFLLVGYVQITVILVLGILLFDVPVLGRISTLYIVSLPFIVASLGVGLLVSALVQNQAQAMQLGFLFLLPNILLSGFMFPRVAMPEPAQWIGAALPLTYFLTVLRGILLKGIGLDILWRETAILTAFAVGLVWVSVRKFRKGLD